eukprot:623509-Prymnesium_polylepis.1
MQRGLRLQLTHTTRCSTKSQSYGLFGFEKNRDLIGIRFNFTFHNGGRAPAGAPAPIAPDPQAARSAGARRRSAVDRGLAARIPGASGNELVDYRKEHHPACVD